MSAAPDFSIVIPTYERPHRLVRLVMPALQWSSTEARRLAAEGADVRPVVGDEVAGYIARHRLYSEN